MNLEETVGEERKSSYLLRDWSRAAAERTRGLITGAQQEVISAVMVVPMVMVIVMVVPMLN